MATHSPTSIIVRRHTKAQKTYLSRVLDPHQRGIIARSMSDMNEQWFFNKIKSAKAKPAPGAAPDITADDLAPV